MIFKGEHNLFSKSLYTNIGKIEMEKYITNILSNWYF